MKVYLAGSIEGLTPDEACGWRKKTKRYLDGIDIYDPTNHIAAYLKNEIITAGKVRQDGKIFAQDLYHLRGSDVMLIRFNRPSIGTLIELGMAYMTGIITIIAFDVTEELKNHPFTRGTVSVFCEDLEEALDYIVNL